jgi:ribose transport system permease protein
MSSTEQQLPASEVTEQEDRAWSMRNLSERFGILLLWAGVIVVFSILRPDTFFTTGNFQTIFGSQAVLLILALALLIPQSTGEFDLSVAGTLGLALVLTAYLDGPAGWGVVPAVLVVLAAGLAVGLINVVFVVVFGVQSIVVTLGMGTLLSGVAYGITIAPISGVSHSLVEFSGHQLFGLQMAFYYAVVITAILWYVYSFTPLGRYMFFVGRNRDIARLAGLRVEAIRSGSLIASALLSTVGGIILAGLLGGASPTVASNYLLPAFAAVFLGSVFIVPGRFNPWGTFVAIYFLITVITGLESLGLQDWIQQVFYGGVLILAVAASTFMRRHAAT